MSDTVIKIEHLSKMYKLGVINNGTLFRDMQSWWALKRGKEDPHAKIGAEKYEGSNTEFWALKDLNFEIKQGDRVGIIGKNGAGKSTLLKILSRITTPTEGTVKIRGRVSSLLEVGTGFHGELTGRENIYLNGAILGMKKREIDRKLDEIIDFSGIEKHIDTPVKRYSSGMYVRLAFAVAAHLDSDILIADEVLAVGDAEFQKKAIGKMSDLSTSQGRTVLFVSHNMAAVRKLCNTGVMLEKGRVKYTGEMEQTIEYYMDEANADLKVRYDLNDFVRFSPVLARLCKINCIELLDKEIASYRNTEKINFKIAWTVLADVENTEFTLTLQYMDDTPVGFIEGRDTLNSYSVGKYETILSFDISNIVAGTYLCYIHISRLSVSNTINDLDQSDAIYLEITDSDVSTVWQRQYWGSVKLNELKCLEV